MEKRITAIMKTQKLTVAAIAISVIILAVTAVLFATSAKEEEMVFVSGRLFLSTHEDVSEMVAYEAAQSEYDSSYIGEIQSAVSNSKTPAEELQSNFGYIGSEIIFNDSGVAVYMDGKWIQFDPKVYEGSVEKEKTEKDSGKHSEGIISQLASSISCSGDSISFTVPEEYKAGTILISGRMEVEGFGGMSVHYLEKESESNLWESGKTYSFTISDGIYTELILTITQGNQTTDINLMEFLPESLKAHSLSLLPQP